MIPLSFLLYILHCRFQYIDWRLGVNLMRSETADGPGVNKAICACIHNATRLKVHIPIKQYQMKIEIIISAILSW